MEFNSNIHVENSYGRPLFKEDGEPTKKTNWKTLATDKMDRKFNPKVHEGSVGAPRLDDSGFLKVRRRDANRKPMGAMKRFESLVDKYRKEDDGYEYYGMGDTAGRMEKFIAHDWEPVMDPETGAVTMKAGRGAEQSVTLHLMRKPKEWYQEDQGRKKTQNIEKEVEAADTGKPEAQYNPLA